MIEDFRALLRCLTNHSVRFLIVGAPLDALGLTRRDFEAPDRVIQFGLPPFRVDVLTSISGVTFDHAWDTRHDGVLLDVPVSFLGRDALIRNKRASGRRKDLEDAAALDA